MPRSLIKGEPNRIWLDCDAEIPIGERPVFWVRVIDWRETRELHRLLYEAQDDDGVGLDEFHQMTMEKLRSVVVKFANMPEDFTLDVEPGEFPKYLSFQEGREILRKAAANHHMDAEEKVEEGKS